MKQVLAGAAPADRSPTPQAEAPSKGAPTPQQSKRNTRLAESDNEAARDLVDIDEKFVVDPAEMNPKAASYVRRRPFLSAEVMRKWRVGYLPAEVEP